MSGLHTVRRSPDPEHVGGGSRPSIAARLGETSEARIGAVLLLTGTVGALIWANVSWTGYETFWQTPLRLAAGAASIEVTVHALVNDVLMSAFFFVVGLEVRREFAIGELTSWSRAMLPVGAAVAGLAVPAGIFVLINLGGSAEQAWGVVISTDTAFVLGALALVGPAAPGRLRIFLLALAVVDDIGALTVIALVYTEHFEPLPLILAGVGAVGIFFARFLRRSRGAAYVVLAAVVWLSVLASGVHPTLAAVVISLLIPVYRPVRREVEHALELTRAFRQSPSTAYARAAASSLRESISINERATSAVAPYVAFLILPVFALANAGVRLSGEVLLRAMMSPITWGVIIALVLGKFLGVFGAVSLLRRAGLGSVGPGLTTMRFAGGAVLCGIGFTISLFIVDLAIQPESERDEARVGILTASLLAFGIATILFRLSDRNRSAEGTPTELARAVDPDRDHISGPIDAPLTIVEYADFQCSFCLRASGSIDEVRRELGDRLRYVWRHAPLTRFHPHALAAAEAAEAAALQGRFFEFGRSLFVDQEHLEPRDILQRAGEAGLDLERFEHDLRSSDVIGRVRDDVLDAEAMDITAVPTFFLNGRRHSGPYDAPTLVAALLDPHPGSGRRAQGMTR